MARLGGSRFGVEDLFQGRIVVNSEVRLLDQEGLRGVARYRVGRPALPVFREIMLRVYQDQLLGRAPRFPRAIEDGIDQYLALQAAREAALAELSDPSPGAQPTAPPAQRP